MAKKSAKNDNGRRDLIITQVIDTLQVGMGYGDVQREDIADEPCVVARLGRRPIVVVYVPEELSSVTPADEEMAVQLGAVVEDGPADYVWATTNGKQGEGYMYSWLPDQECQVSEIPAADALKKKTGQNLSRAAVSADPAKFKELQREFDELHEQVYASREPVDGSNDLTAQLCKLIFLKMHLERHRDFRVGDDPLFEEVFQPDYILEHKSNAVAAIKR